MGKIGIISLGCPKNLVDSEVMLGHLRARGYTSTDRADEAEVLVVNTCAFIRSAKEESIQAILEAAEMKQRGKCKKLIVAGCMVERYRDALLAEMPEIDAVVGTREIERIMEAIQNTEKTLPAGGHDPLYVYGERSPRFLTTHKAMAYIKISEGCGHSCAFCAIPAIRGPHRSRPVADILKEARRLVDAGVLEINLVGQDTTEFGRDLGGPGALESLIRGLGKTEGLKWFRLHYAHPARLGDRLLGAMAETENCCKYLDIPLQHADSRVLKAMSRGGGRIAFTDLVERVRRRVPDVFMRTSFIVGFPGEDPAAFGELRDFLAEAQFDHVGVFTYSREEGTPAYPLGDPVRARTKENRRRILMELQAGISKKRNGALIGRKLEVLVEGLHEETDMIVKARHRGQAPEIDGSVLIVGGEPEPHTIQEARITEAHEYDLVGIIEGSETRI